jgi:dTDP-4-dehydrorhamnose 3,5-epimerase-like enzyme
MTTINNIQFIKLPVVEDSRGNLAYIQNDVLPFHFKRVYYLFDVPSTSQRGGHSHINQNQILIALSGSFEVVIHDGKNEKRILLNKPNIGLQIVPGLWRELQNFSSGAVCLVIAEDVFDENDYIRDFELFKKSKT